MVRPVQYHRLGEVRDRSFENQRFRASGLSVVVAAIVLWNTVYLERAVGALRAAGVHIDDALMPHMSPLGWDHISLTGDFLWREDRRVQQGQFRHLRKPGDSWPNL